MNAEPAANPAAAVMRVNCVAVPAPLRVNPLEVTPPVGVAVPSMASR